MFKDFMRKEFCNKRAALAFGSQFISASIGYEQLEVRYADYLVILLY